MLPKQGHEVMQSNINLGIIANAEKEEQYLLMTQVKDTGSNVNT